MCDDAQFEASRGPWSSVHSSPCSHHTVCVAAARAFSLCAIGVCYSPPSSIASCYSSLDVHAESAIRHCAMCNHPNDPHPASMCRYCRRAHGCRHNTRPFVHGSWRWRAVGAAVLDRARPRPEPGRAGVEGHDLRCRARRTPRSRLEHESATLDYRLDCIEHTQICCSRA